MKKKNFAFLSLEKKKYVCGYEIKKMPLGEFLQALQYWEELPEELLSKCFGTNNLEEVIALIQQKKDWTIVLQSVIVKAPLVIVGFISTIFNIPQDRLLNDETIGFYGLCTMIETFVELNDLGKCSTVIERIRKKLRIQTLTGSRI